MGYFIKRYGVLIGIVLFVIIGFLLTKSNQNDKEEVIDPIESDRMQMKAEQTEDVLLDMDQLLLVDVKGAVKRPGVYELPADARVKDVIELAGGLTQLADQTQVNLAQKIHDEMVVFVPAEGDEVAPTTVNGAFPSSTGQTLGDTTAIQINRASAEEIQSLNGIGEKKAQAILDHIAENGPFQTVEELTNVSGIGEKTLENMRDQIIVP